MLQEAFENNTKSQLKSSLWYQYRHFRMDENLLMNKHSEQLLTDTILYAIAEVCEIILVDHRVTTNDVCWVENSSMHFVIRFKRVHLCQVC